MFASMGNLFNCLTSGTGTVHQCSMPQLCSSGAKDGSHHSAVVECRSSLSISVRVWRRGLVPTVSWVWNRRLREMEVIPLPCEAADDDSCHGRCGRRFAVPCRAGPVCRAGARGRVKVGAAAARPSTAPSELNITRLPVLPNADNR